jgi:hypothetical protein
VYTPHSSTTLPLHHRDLGQSPTSAISHPYGSGAPTAIEIT